MRTAARTPVAWAARVVALLLLAALATLGAAVGSASPAYAACTCTQQSTAQQARAADLVMVGTLTGRERAHRPGASASAGARSSASQQAGGTVVYTFRPERLYKGELEGGSVRVSSPARARACGLGRLPVDRSYLVFAEARGGSYHATVCSGTSRASPAAISGIESVLGSGSPVAVGGVPDPQLRVVEQDGPTGFTRLAAPGAALVLLGVLGLVLVRRLRR